jgi:pimeloyl-ACP methyl ester carboxylesterase
MRYEAMRGGWEINERSSGGYNVAVYQPYLLDVDKVSDRLTRFRSAYQEKVCLVDSQRWRYRRTGNSARPLVMLPGVQGGGAVFFDVALALGDRLDLITVTAPPIVDAAAMADAQAEFLLTLAIQKIDLFGSSLGGYLAQVFCNRHPDMVGQLFLANSFTDPRPFLAKAPSSNTVAEQAAEAVVAFNLAPVLTADPTDAGQVALQTVMRALVGPVQTADEYKARLITLLESRPIDRIPVSDDRVVLIDDDADPSILPEMRALIRERYGSARHYMIAGGGHLPAIQRPLSVVSVLLDRLGRD